MIRRLNSCFLILTAFFMFSACDVLLPWTLEIQTKTAGPDGKFAAGVEVALEGKFVGLTDDQGQLTVSIEAQATQKLSWSFRAQSAESMILPQKLVTESPDFWDWMGALQLGERPRLKVAPFLLKEVAWQGLIDDAVPETNGSTGTIVEEDLSVDQNQMAEAGNLATPLPKTHDTTTAAPEKSEVPQISSPGELIGPLPSADEPQIAANTESKIQDEIDENIKDILSTQEKLDVSKQVSNQDIIKKQEFKFIVKSQSKLLPGAAISIWNSLSNRFLEIGETDGNGELATDMPYNANWESVYIRHTCCVSLIKSLAKKSEKLGTAAISMVAVELVQGVSHDFWVGMQSYGVFRGVGKVLVSAAGRSLGSSSDQGLLQILGKNLTAGPVSVGAASEAEIVSKVEQAFLLEEKSNVSPHFVEVAPKEQRKPIVGFLETVEGRPETSDTSALFNKPYRRFRREVLTQLSRQLILRPMLGAELSARFRNVGFILPGALEKGWDLSHLQGEVDFVIWVDRTKPSDVLLRLVHPSGVFLAEKSWPLFGNIPEAQGAQALKNVLEQLPLEVAVADKNGSVVVGKDWLKYVSTGQKFKRVRSLSAEKFRKAIDTCQAQLVVSVEASRLEGNCDLAIQVGDVFARCGLNCEISRNSASQKTKVKH